MLKDKGLGVKVNNESTFHNQVYTAQRIFVA